MKPCTPDDDADQQQVETLCDDLSARAEAARAEQVAVALASQPPGQQQRMLVEQARARYHRLRVLIQHYCGRP